MYRLNIKKYREKKKWSQRKLSTMSGVSQSAISAIETLQKKPTVYTIDKICIALEICPYLLIKFDCCHICKWRCSK